MPARKPLDLQTRHATKSERANRAEAEESMRSEVKLPANPPSQLKHNKVAMATWRRMIREYGRVEAEIVSRLDMDLLIDYCITTAQISEIDVMRDVAHDVWLALAGRYSELKKNKETDEAVEMALKVSGAFDKLIKLDARADQKRKLLVTMRQSLYLTPRARAGTAPKEKPPAAPEDPFEEFLNKVPTRKGLDDGR